MKKIIAITLVLIMSFTSTCFAFDYNDVIDTVTETAKDVATETVQNISIKLEDLFKDIKVTDWFYQAVQKMTELGIFKGYPDGTIKPQKAVTYGEFIKMFTVAVTREDVGNSTSGYWATNYYNKGIELGLYTEYDIKESDLKDGIPRKLMAVLISNHFKEAKVDNYDFIKDSIEDLDEGRPYQHEIIKAYGLGILTGYPNGTFKPDNTLTRAESATVISRVLNESERKAPKFEAPIADDAYWKNDPNYDEMVEWLESNQNGVVWGAPFYIEEGKIYFTASDEGDRWTADNKDYPKLHEHVYTALKAYYEYAKPRNMGIFINSATVYDKIIVGLRENTKTQNTLFYIGFSGNPEYYEVDPNYVPSYVFFNQSRYWTQEDADKLGVDLLIAKDRLGNQSLVDLNRKILKDIYGDSTGNKIMDYAIQQYKATFDEINVELIDLPNVKTTIDGINIFYFDNTSGINALYMDQPK